MSVLLVYLGYIVFIRPGCIVYGHTLLLSLMNMFVSLKYP